MQVLPYALAKELKDTGWPQHDANQNGDWVNDPDNVPDPDFNVIPVYSPSLDELIEACPREFEVDGYKGGFELVYGLYSNGEWTAGYRLDEGRWSRADGSTRKEAVAKLWIKLNSQK